MKKYYMSLNDCISIWSKLTSEIQDHVYDGEESERWIRFLRTILMQHEALQEEPPNLKKFSSGGVGIMKTDSDMKHEMPEEWRQNYSNVELSIFSICHGVKPGDGTFPDADE